MQKVNTHWVFEKDVFDENVPGLIAEVNAQGMEYSVINYSGFDNVPKLPFGPEMTDKPVFYYGSYNLGGCLQRNVAWYPNVYCDAKEFECSHYYTKLGKYLLNDWYTMFPYGELRRPEFVSKLFRDWGHSNTIFIRPSSGLKTFTGQTLTKENFEHSLEMMSCYEPAEDALVVVSTPKKILAEWRVIIVDGKAISASQYKINGKSALAKGANDVILAYAEEIAKTWQPERGFTIDIGMDYGNGYKLIEINSLSSSGWYDCDKQRVVESVSRLAQDEWNEVFKH